MILNFKEGCIASGRVTSKGGDMSIVGKNDTAKYHFSIQVSAAKKEDGTWDNKFLDCVLWGKLAEQAPDLNGGEYVFCTGKMVKNTWKGKDGKEHESETLNVDFITVSYDGSSVKSAFNPGKNYFSGVEDEFEEDEEEPGKLPF